MIELFQTFILGWAAGVIMVCILDLIEESKVRKRRKEVEQCIDLALQNIQHITRDVTERGISNGD